MKIARPQCNYKDERGEIIDILSKEHIEHVTLITSVKGVTRGNHYHKETLQIVYIIEGKIELLTQMPDSPIMSTILEKGDLAITYPMERHAMVTMEDSTFIVFTRGIRGGDNYEKDTYRLSEPLRKPTST